VGVIFVVGKFTLFWVVLCVWFYCSGVSNCVLGCVVCVNFLYCCKVLCFMWCFCVDRLYMCKILLVFCVLYVDWLYWAKVLCFGLFCLSGLIVWGKV